MTYQHPPHHRVHKYALSIGDAVYTWVVVASKNDEHASMIQFHSTPGPNSTLPYRSQQEQNQEKDPSSDITMMIDSGASHILVRKEHSHILKYISISETNTQPFANVRPAKIGSELSPIGRGLL